MKRYVLAGVLALLPFAAYAQDEQADNEHLAKQLANPVADLISLPIQFNYDSGYGPGSDGERVTTNIQPIIPFSMNSEWNVISRTILPVIWQDDIPTKTDGETFGLGDTTQSFFFSPKHTQGGEIWGIGPAILIPTATDDVLGQKKLGLGPTGVLLQQVGPWTYGALMNHIWSVAGPSSRPEVSATFLQPFLSYTTPQAVTYTLTSESTYDWKGSNFTCPLEAGISKLYDMGGQKVQLGGQVRYWLDSPRYGPNGWGGRVQVTFLFPK